MRLRGKCAVQFHMCLPHLHHRSRRGRESSKRRASTDLAPSHNLQPLSNVERRQSPSFQNRALRRRTAETNITSRRKKSACPFPIFATAPLLHRHPHRHPQPTVRPSEVADPASAPPASRLLLPRPPASRGRMWAQRAASSRAASTPGSSSPDTRS